MQKGDKMNDMAQLRKEDIGKWVLYEGMGGEKEKGRIKSWNATFIFVVYKCDGQWDRFQDFTGNATSPESLRFTTLEEII